MIELVALLFVFFFFPFLPFLFVGDPSLADNTIDLKMVDFAHTFPLEPDQQNDDGYEFGLSNLIKLLEEIYSRHSSTPN